MKYSTIKVILFLAFITGSIGAIAQDKSAAEVKEMLQSKNFVFNAQFVNPQAGSTRALTSSYDLTVRPDSLTSYLPYFGRAYSAPINPSEGGIKFTSTNFDYNAQKGKKEKWAVSIKPHDAPEVQQLILTVFDNGNATLSVTSTNRQQISYNGYVTKGAPVNKKAF
jgi:hypothetical protein